MIEKAKKYLNQCLQEPPLIWENNSLCFIMYGVLLAFAHTLPVDEVKQLNEWIKENYPAWGKIFDEIDSQI